MIRQNLAIIIFVLVALFMRPLFASPSAKELLLQSASYFDKGQYQKALQHLAPVDIRAAFDNSDDMKLAFKIRAIAYDHTGDVERASETIRELFFLDPNYQFNPFDTPKSVVAIAQKEKAAIDEKNMHLALIKRDTEPEATAERAHIAQNKQKPERIVMIEKKPVIVTTLFPFGINHFYLASPVKGAMYFSLQTLSLVTNVAAFWWKTSYLASFGSARLTNNNDIGKFQTAQTIQYISLGTLIISYGISVIDALIRFKSIPSQKVKLDEITS
jgi:tetratricopeptide (TPR) repeat protein